MLETLPSLKRKINHPGNGSRRVLVKRRYRAGVRGPQPSAHAHGGRGWGEQGPCRAGMVPPLRHASGGTRGSVSGDKGAHRRRLMRAKEMYGVDWSLTFCLNPRPSYHQLRRLMCQLLFVRSVFRYPSLVWIPRSFYRYSRILSSTKQWSAARL